MNSPHYNHNTGRADDGPSRKADALDRHESRHEAFLRRARRALLLRALMSPYVTADEVRTDVALPSGVGPRTFGAVPSPLAAAGIITADGYVMSTRPEAHARPVTRWVIRDRAKATAWLRDNPEIADPPKPEPNVDQPNLFEMTEPGAATPGPDSTVKWRTIQ